MHSLAIRRLIYYTTTRDSTVVKQGHDTYPSGRVMLCQLRHVLHAQAMCYSTERFGRVIQQTYNYEVCATSANQVDAGAMRHRGC